MINTLFLIRNEKEYQIAERIIEKRCLNDSVILSWNEKSPFLVNRYSQLENVMKWEDFQVKDISLSSYWLKNYKQVEYIARKKIERFCRNEIAKSPHFIFGLVWNLGDSHCKYIDVLNVFFKNYKPEVIFFNSRKGFISGLMLSFMRVYGVKHERLAL